MAKTSPDLKMQLNKETETLQRTQTKMKMELKNSVTQREHTKRSRMSRVSQAKDGVSGLIDKGEDLNRTSKGYEN